MLEGSSGGVGGCKDWIEDGGEVERINRGGGGGSDDGFRLRKTRGTLAGEGTVHVSSVVQNVF